MLQLQIQTKIKLVEFHYPSLNSGQCSMDYDQWADHPPDHLQLLIRKRCSNTYFLNCFMMYRKENKLGIKNNRLLKNDPSECQSLFFSIS